MAESNSNMREEARKARDLVRKYIDKREGAAILGRYVTAQFRVKTNKEVCLRVKRVETVSKKIYLDTRVVRPNEPTMLTYPFFEQLVKREYRENGGRFKKGKKAEDMYMGDTPLKIKVLEIDGVQEPPPTEVEVPEEEEAAPLPT